MDTLQGRELYPNCFNPSEKGSTLNGKNLLLLGANFFHLEYTPFRKGLMCRGCKQKGTKVVYTPFQKGSDMQRSKQVVTKVVSPVKKVENLPTISNAHDYH